MGLFFYVFPSFSTAVNPLILFVFSSNYRQTLKSLGLYLCDVFKCPLLHKSGNRIASWQTDNIAVMEVRQIPMLIKQTIAAHLAQNYEMISVRGSWSAEITCSEKRTVFREQGSRKAVTFKEQIMYKDKYQCTFLKPNGGCCFYYSFNIFLNVK